MTTPVRNLLGGAAAAAVLVIVMFRPTIAGVGAWKWMLALVGLGLWFLAERAQPPRF